MAMILNDYDIHNNYDISGHNDSKSKYKMISLIFHKNI